ncbi:CbtA family protein [Streptomyces sp. NPDC097619]|uniref:CbtA family protein n=1 Tax=Streptomyces sp. NPDC097619 TaxID=3157228 RepID=UPI00331BA82C
MYSNAVRVRGLLVRGMLAGLIAGLIAFAFGYVAGEPSVDASIAVEEAQAAADRGGHHGAAAAPAEEEEEEVVSRAAQSTSGLATGLVVYGVALGGIASLAFAFAFRRIGGFGPRATAAFTAAGVFTTVFLVPFLKYPATPPAVGNPDTIGSRTTLFFLMILLSVLVGLGAVIAGRRLAPRLGNWNASVLAGAGYVLVMAVLFAVLPDNEDAVKASFPAAVLWEFRLASIGLQTVLWATFGLVFGALTERLLTPRPTPTPDPDPARAAAA